MIVAWYWILQGMGGIYPFLHEEAFYSRGYNNSSSK